MTIAIGPVQVAVPLNLQSNNASLEWRMGGGGVIQLFHHGMRMGLTWMESAVKFSPAISTIFSRVNMGQ